MPEVRVPQVRGAAVVVQRAALLVTTASYLVGLWPALDVRPDPADPHGVPVLPLAVAAAQVAITALTLVLFLPVWRGGRRAAAWVAATQVVSALTALPAFVAPPEYVGWGGVALAAASLVVSAVLFLAIALPLSPWVLTATTAALATAAYAALAAAAAVALPGPGQRAAQAASALAVAVAFGPTRRLLRRTIGTALFGGRVDPPGTALTIGARVRDGGSPGAALADMCSALGLPGAEVLDDGVVVAGAGRVTGAVAEVPMSAAGTQASTEPSLVLRVALRPGVRRLLRDDRAALELVVSPLALLVRADRLTARLAEARAAAAEVREQERSRLHRELHDSLGPLLTGALYRVDAAVNLLDAPSPSSSPAAEPLAAATSDLRAALASVRRVAYGLRPVELEEHGVWEALRRRVSRAGRLDVTLDLPDPEPVLGAALELAVHHVASEALANTLRHSTGSRVLVSVTAAPGGPTVVEVVDDGEPPTRWSPGVGLTSLRERVEELRGVVEVGPSGSGWRVVASLPAAAGPNGG